MGTIEDRNGMDLTGAEDIKKKVARIQREKKEYTEKLYKKKKISVTWITTMV